MTHEIHGFLQFFENTGGRVGHSRELQLGEELLDDVIDFGAELLFLRRDDVHEDLSVTIAAALRSKIARQRAHEGPGHGQQFLLC